MQYYVVVYDQKNKAVIQRFTHLDQIEMSNDTKHSFRVEELKPLTKYVIEVKYGPISSMYPPVGYNVLCETKKSSMQKNRNNDKPIEIHLRKENQG